MSKLIYFLLLIYAKEAGASLSFKKDAVATMQYIPYCFVMLVLLIILWVLAKYLRPKIKSKQEAKLLDTIAIHNKTKAYILVYQNQQFLIAENPNAIAIHVLQQGEC
jgi:biopolymer transport protein ExbD